VVERGQVLERMTLVAAGALLLEALFQHPHVDGRAPLLIVGPHPRYFGNMDAAIAGECVWRAGLRGHASLRYNHRGVGASQGNSSLLSTADVDVLADDARLVRAHLADTCACDVDDIAVVGISFGAIVAAQLDASSLVLVAPPVHVFGSDAVERARAAGAHAICGAEDPARALLSSSPRPLHVIPDADHHFQRNLPLFARRVVSLLFRDDTSDDMDG
jgi:uncharacterized protein